MFLDDHINADIGQILIRNFIVDHHGGIKGQPFQGQFLGNLNLNLGTG